MDQDTTPSPSGPRPGREARRPRPTRRSRARRWRHLAATLTTAFCLVTAVGIAAAPAATAATNLTPPSLTISQTHHDYGTVAIGTPSAPVTYVVTNQGQMTTGQFQVQVVGNNPGDFLLHSNTCTVPLGGGQSCSISVFFRPSVLGSRSALLWVNILPYGTVTSSDTVQAGMVGVGGTAQLGANATSMSFGNVASGTSATQTLTLINTGVAPTGGLNPTFSGANPVDFALASPRPACLASIPVGGHCDVPVTFTPKALGARGATLTVAGNPGGSVAVALSGTGATPAHLVIGPATFDFGFVPVGNSLLGQIGIKNVGQVDSGPLSITFTGADAGAFHYVSGCVGPLGAGQTCTLNVSFQPTAVHQYTATVSATANPGDTATGTLTGAGPTPAQLAVAPATFDFGSVASDGSSTQTFTVTNTGQSLSGKVSATLTGPDASAFRIDTLACGTVVPGADHGCSLTVRFTPGSVTRKSAALSLAASPGGTAVAYLTGTGFDRAHLAITPATYDFGQIAADQSSRATTFTVVNDGHLASGPVSVALAGPDAAAFTIDSTTCGAALPAGGSCSVVAHYTAGETAATATASLSATATPGDTATSTLQGEPVIPPILTMTPIEYHFLNVPIGTSAFKDFVVTDSGLQGTDAVLLFPEGDPAFRISHTTCGGPLAKGDSCVVTVEFDATDTNTHTWSLGVCPDVNGALCASTFDMEGTGVRSAHFSVTAPPDFGSAVTGSDGGFQTVTVVNDGVQASGAVTAAVSGANAGDFTVDGSGCTTLAVHQSCQLKVHFAPGAVGARAATLTISGNPGGTAAVTLHGTGIEVGFAPPSYAFAAQPQGTSSDATDFVLVNHGSTPLAGLMVTGADPSHFSIAGGSCLGATVPAGGSCTVSVVFNADEPGAYSSTFTASYLAGGAPGMSTLAVTGTSV